MPVRANDDHTNSTESDLIPLPPAPVFDPSSCAVTPAGSNRVRPHRRASNWVTLLVFLVKPPTCTTHFYKTHAYLPLRLDVGTRARTSQQRDFDTDPQVFPRAATAATNAVVRVIVISNQTRNYAHGYPLNIRSFFRRRPCCGSFDVTYPGIRILSSALRLGTFP